MTIKEAINYVSYFMDTHEAKGEFSEAWSVIFKALAESTNSSHNTASTPLPACITCAVPNCGMKAGYCGLYKPQ